MRSNVQDWTAFARVEYRARNEALLWGVVKRGSGGGAVADAPGDPTEARDLSRRLQLRSVTPIVNLACRRAAGTLLRLAQRFVDSLKEGEDGCAFVALELLRDLEESIEQRTDRAVDDRPPATGGLKHDGAAVARMRTAADETSGLESIGEPGHRAGAHTQRVSEVSAGRRIPARGTDQRDELGRAQPMLPCLRGEEVLHGSREPS
jgi:hypothetical protein